MNIDEQYKGNFLKVSDLKGQAVKVTMAEVKIEKMGDDMKPVVYFHGKELGLALNKTNKNRIKEAYGVETDGWKDKPLELYPDRTEFKGEIVDCIRVRVPLPPQAEAATVADDESF